METPSRPRRRPRLFLGWLVLAKLSPIPFSVQTLFHPGKAPQSPTEDEGRRRRAYVEPGATLADFDEAAQFYGLATPVGINSTTGIAGLTLGGGFGWLTRKYGMTIDNLVSAGAVTAEGKRIRVSENENSDLFWAIRGGGGNFGIITQFEFKLHEVGPEILAGLIVFPFDQAKQVLTQYREFVKSAPEELNVWAVLRKAPPLPFLSEDVHGKEVVVLAIFHIGDAAQGRKLIEPLLRFGTPHGEHIGAQPYTQWQKAFDPLLTPGARNYWKSHNFTELKPNEKAGPVESINSDGQMPTSSQLACFPYDKRALRLADLLES